MVPGVRLYPTIDYNNNRKSCRDSLDKGPASPRTVGTCLVNDWPDVPSRNGHIGTTIQRMPGGHAPICSPKSYCCVSVSTEFRTGIRQSFLHCPPPASETWDSHCEPSMWGHKHFISVAGCSKGATVSHKRLFSASQKSRFLDTSQAKWPCGPTPVWVHRAVFQTPPTRNGQKQAPRGPMDPLTVINIYPTGSTAMFSSMFFRPCLLCSICLRRRSHWREPFRSQVSFFGFEISVSSAEHPSSCHAHLC